MKLNLGCAKDVREGWVNVDMHYEHPLVTKADILTLEYEKNSVEQIVAKDIIEHLPLQVTITNINKWYYWLQEGGSVFIQTTNFDKIIEAYRQGVWPLRVLNHMLFAGVNYTDVGSQDCDFHKSVYSKEGLTNILQEAGFTVTSVKEDEIDNALRANPMCHNLNIEIIARK
jgi:predicted SAM-dependent methyltransferase